MRTLYTCILLLLLTDTFGQLLIDTTISKQYNQAFIRLPKQIHQAATEFEKDTSYKGGIGILSEFEIDTLNKEEMELSPVTIISLGSERKENKKYKSDSFIVKKENRAELLFCIGQYNYDTLVVNTSLSFNAAIIQKISHSYVETNYTEHQGNDSISWSEKAFNKTNELTISAKTIKLIVSDTNFSSDKTLYGYCEIETEPYYTSEILFEKGYIKKRLRFTYYFKFKPIQKTHN